MSGLVLLAFTGGARGVRPGIDDAAKARGIVVVYESGCATPAYLLAVGPEGGAALARWVAEHGLAGVTGVGLVGVTAPWAERGACYGEWVGGSGGHKRWKRCGAPSDYVSSFDADDADPEPLCQKHFDALNPNVRDMWKPARVLLGPLEPLRAVAERARCGVCRLCGGEGSGPCGDCGGRGYPLRLIIACAPDDGVCPSPGCGGRGWHYGPGFSRPQCDRCAGSGKALSSAEVACELLGRRIPDSQSSDGDGAMEVFVWHPDDARRLVEFALPFVVERLVR